MSDKPEVTPDTGEAPPDTGEAPEEVARPSEFRRRSLKVAARIRRWLRRFGKAVLLVFLLLGLAVILIAQTGRGHEIALDAAMDRAERELAGELTVQEVRSGTLLRGGTIAGVRLTTGDGRPFLSADSIEFRYSIINAITGGPPVRSIVIWGLDVEISQYTAEQSMNVTQILVRGDSTSGGSSDGRPFELGRVGVRNGRARILTPAEAGDPRTVEGPEGEPLRELRFDSLDLDLEETILAPQQIVQFGAQIASFSSHIAILDEPLVVEEVFGQLAFGREGIQVTDASYRLPGSLMRGTVNLGPESDGGPWVFRSSLRTVRPGALADLRWLDPRIPDGTFSGGVDLRGAGGVRAILRDVEVELEASEIGFDGPVRFDPGITMEGLRVSANPVPLERLEPWIERSLPLDGWLSGEAVFTGTFIDLDAEGRVTLVPTGLGATPTTADFSGVIHRGVSPGASGFTISLDPFNYTVLESVWPDFPWSGTGFGLLELEGRVEDGMEIGAAFTHNSAAGLTSRADIRGTVWYEADIAAEADTVPGVEAVPAGWVTALDVDLLPLAVGTLSSLAPDLGLRGSVAGPVQIDGSLTDLHVHAELLTDDGGFEIDGRVDLTDVQSGYSLTADSDSIHLSALSAALPPETSWSGHLEIAGRGFGLDTLDATARLVSGTTRIGDIRIDSLAANLAVSGGVLTTDSLRGSVAGIEVTGDGRLGLAPGRWGNTRFAFSGPSLVGFRPILMGISESVLVRDSISELEAELLRFDGVDPDTLPEAMDVRLRGVVAGAASVSGEIGDLDLGLIVDVFDGAYQQNEVDSVRIAFSATDLPATTGEWEIGATARGIVWEGRTFDLGGFEADMFELGGEGRVELVRRPGEQYRAVGAFVLDSIGGEVDLSEASIQIDEDRWDLVRSARLAWDGANLEVDSLLIQRLGDDPMQLEANGRVTRGGESDFELSVEGLHAEQVMHVLQEESLEVGGHLDLDVRVTGPAEAPVITSSFRIDGGRYGAMQLSRLEGLMEYEDRLADFEIDGWDGARVAMSANGEFPIDLALTPVEDRVVEESIDMRISADSLDAAIALAYVTSLQGVLGTVTGEVWVSGTPRAPQPEGSVRLTDGEWSIDAIGIRHTEVNGELRLNPDRTVDVDLTSTGAGRSEVSGQLTLLPFRDPVLNLRFDFTRFQAVARADMEGLISGGFNLTGSYRRPVAQGELVVDEGTIYVDELQRAAGIVDLTDSFLLDDGLAIDTTALVSQPLIAGFQNPFFDNLRVDVDMSVPRGSWLRSLESDIEMSGDLLVRYDRRANDFVLIGELEAVRGSHLVLGRSFELDGGTVNFIGRPGLNPDLDIQASSRIRRPDEPPFEVNAQVDGSLVRPIVTLTTEETGLAEEDLVSYLLFGQPSSALGGRSSAGLREVQSTNTLTQFADAAVTYVGGALANQVGTAIARELSLDYVSVQQGGLRRLGGDYLADTQLELGRYIGRDAFVVLVLRPVGASGPEEQNTVAGVRVEWALSDDYNVEGFFEDRFLRSGSQLLGASAGLVDNTRILGLFFFREWGYTPGADGQQPTSEQR